MEKKSNPHCTRMNYRYSKTLILHLCARSISPPVLLPAPSEETRRGAKHVTRDRF